MSPMFVFDDVEPQWSPDGTRILFAEPSNGIADFWTLDHATGDRTMIGSGSSASWLDDDTVVLTDYLR